MPSNSSPCVLSRADFHDSPEKSTVQGKVAAHRMSQAHWAHMRVGLCTVNICTPAECFRFGAQSYMTLDANHCFECCLHLHMHEPLARSCMLCAISNPVSIHWPSDRARLLPGRGGGGCTRSVANPVLCCATEVAVGWNQPLLLLFVRGTELESGQQLGPIRSCQENLLK